MKFEKESFVNFLKSLKNGSDLIVQAIKDRGSKQDEHFSTLETSLTEAQKKFEEIKSAINKKEIDLKPLETAITQQLEKIDLELKIIETTIVNNTTEEVKVTNPVEILKPSWLPKFEISLDPITNFFEDIKNLLKKITEKEAIVLPVKNGRILVEVDRVGGGGGSTRISTAKIEEGLAKIQPASGAGVCGTRDLTNANTWYAVPATIPTAPYILVVSIENAIGTVRFGFSNSAAPSSSNGNIAPSHLTINLAEGEQIYYASSVAGDDVNWTTKEI